MTTQEARVEQRHREAAVALLGRRLYAKRAQAMLDGQLDEHSFVQAIARFERDHMAQPGAVVGETQNAPCICGNDPCPGHTIDEADALIAAAPSPQGGAPVTEITKSEHVRPDMLSQGDGKERARLIDDVKALKAHHAFTRDRIGQPGCEVRKVAAEYVETIDAVLAALQQPDMGGASE